MSYEYRIVGGGSAVFDGVVRRLAELGLRVLKSSPNAVSLTHPEDDPAQVIRWGGNVQVERAGPDLFVTLNAAKQRKQILDLLVTELSAQGFRVSAEEV